MNIPERALGSRSQVGLGFRVDIEEHQTKPEQTQSGPSSCRPKRPSALNLEIVIRYQYSYCSFDFSILFSMYSFDS